MNCLVENVLQRTTSLQPELRDEARLQLAMLLERHSPLANSPRFYEDVISHNLSSLILTELELNELLTRICKLVMVRQLPPDILLWGLRTEALSTVLETLLCFVSEYGNELDSKTTGDVLNGFDRCLAAVDQSLRTRLSYLISTNNPTPFLQKLIGAENSIEGLAIDVMNKVNDILRETQHSNH